MIVEAAHGQANGKLSSRTLHYAYAKHMSLDALVEQLDSQIAFSMVYSILHRNMHGWQTQVTMKTTYCSGSRSPSGESLVLPIGIQQETVLKLTL